jgi:outer membrane protein OmpA-like peptidoglycan-associated protein
VEEKNSQKTIDLAYVAERTAQIAEATAQTVISTQRTATAGKAFGDEQGRIVKDTKGALAKSRADLVESERGQAEQVRKTDIERTGRQNAEANAAASELKAAASEEKAAASDEKVKEANDALARLAAKDEARGLVITLSGGVLFRSNDATLLPAAQARLNEVADALVSRGSDVVVEGYTDSKGSLASNMGLSQRRAESVRGYLVSRGFPQAKIQARGLGPDRPVAENTSSEGRANNRRVEIVIDKTTTRTSTN